MNPADIPGLRIDGAIATVALRRPQLANRLELADLATLRRLMAQLTALPQVRVVVLESAGPHFCSGFQIDAVPGVDAPALFEELCDAWEALPQITLAAIHGGVWGGATDLALACDFRLGTPACQMAIPAARLGLHYHGGGMRRLVSRLGLGPAKRLLLAAQTLPASAMLEAHFLDELLPTETALRQRVADWAKEIAALAPLALSGMKRHLNALGCGPLNTQDLKADQARCAESQDLQEGVRAWTARRAPSFEGH